MTTDQGTIEGGLPGFATLTVLSTVPIFYLSVFSIPEGIQKRLDGVMRKFVWSGPDQIATGGPALITWNTACRPLNRGAWAYYT